MKQKTKKVLFTASYQYKNDRQSCLNYTNSAVSAVSCRLYSVSNMYTSDVSYSKPHTTPHCRPRHVANLITQSQH